MLLCRRDYGKLKQRNPKTSQEKVFDKYKNLEKIVIEDIWQKYVPISREGGE